MQTINAKTTTIEATEERLFASATSFTERMQEISYMSIEKEADVLAAKAAMDQLISDMQAFSNSLILEGPESGILLTGTVLGNDFAVSEGTRSAAA